MPTYDHLCENCNEEFEDFYSIKDPIPTTCPRCKVEGKVKRLISGGSGKGIVELTGQDLKDYAKAEGAKFRKEVYSSEKTYANFIGDSKYQAIQSKLDRK